jgi:hypothetical protein
MLGQPSSLCPQRYILLTVSVRVNVDSEGGGGQNLLAYHLNQETAMVQWYIHKAA